MFGISIGAMLRNIVHYAHANPKEPVRTYKATVLCSNCKRKSTVNVPRGKYLASMSECPNCGCHTVQNAI